MNEESKRCCEKFKKAFTKEQRKNLILGLIERVPVDYLLLLSNVHSFDRVYDLRDSVNGYLEELMEREES